MAHIEGLEASRAGVFARIGYWMSRRMFGRVAEPLRVTAHNRWIFRAYAGYEWALGKARRVDPKLKALGGIKAATLVGCPF